MLALALSLAQVGLSIAGRLRRDAALTGAAYAAPAELIGAMPEGGAEAIASRGTVPHDELLDHAAMESGTD